MRTLAILALVQLAVLAGCSSTNDAEIPRRNELWQLDAIRGAALHRALVVQSAIFEYHFVPGSAVLNELGERDLGILAEHFRSHSGSLSVRRGGAGSEMYDARVAAVVDALVAAGVSDDFVRIHDGYPGGDGMAGERLLVILEPEDDSGPSLPTLIVPLGQ